MKRKSERILSGLLVAAVLIVAANAWLAFHVEDVLADSESWVVHTWQAINSVQVVLNSLDEMETGARGYILTSDIKTLAPYYVAKARVAPELINFQALTSDNPRQQERATALRALAAERIEYLEKGVALQQSGQKDAVMELVRQGTGRIAMSKIRILTSDMQKEEYALLTGRQHDSARARTEARLTVALASALDILFIVFSVFSLRRERTLREETIETAEKLERLLYISDVALAALPPEELSTEILRRIHGATSADAVVLYQTVFAGSSSAALYDAVKVFTAVGVDLPAGQILHLQPLDPLSRARQHNAIVRLQGSDVRELAIGELSHRMETMLIVPLTAQGTSIGLLVAGFNATVTVGPSQEELLRVAADRMASALDRASLLDSEREARRIAENSAAEVIQLNAELEERVRQRTNELEVTNRELEAFSYSVSHDLRAPLRSVDGLSVALEEDYGDVLKGDGSHYLKRIRLGVQRMGQLIDALLQLSRITRAELSSEPVDLTATAADVAEAVIASYPERTLHFHIQPGLHCEGDPRLLRVIFENMFGNAAKFTAKQPHAEISFGWSPEKSAYFIRDNGAGFDQQYAGKLFVAFQRLHGEKDFQGSGIGLATVARVIRRHHGTITAEGVVGQGATFWFTLA